MTTNSFASKQMNIAVRLDKWLDLETKTIQKMISDWENIESIRNALIDSVSEPGLYPEVLLFTNKCIDDISLVLDESWNEIRIAQERHMKNIQRARNIVKAIKC